MGSEFAGSAGERLTRCPRVASDEGDHDDNAGDSLAAKLSLVLRVYQVLCLVICVCSCARNCCSPHPAVSCVIVW